MKLKQLVGSVTVEKNGTFMGLCRNKKVFLLCYFLKLLVISEDNFLAIV